jgi:hypothetical protein
MLKHSGLVTILSQTTFVGRKERLSSSVEGRFLSEDFAGRNLETVKARPKDYLKRKKQKAKLKARPFPKKPCVAVSSK